MGHRAWQTLAQVAGSHLCNNHKRHYIPQCHYLVLRKTGQWLYHCQNYP